jgi:hypothetical protein
MKSINDKPKYVSLTTNTFIQTFVSSVQFRLLIHRAKRTHLFSFCVCNDAYYFCCVVSC